MIIARKWVAIDFGGPEVLREVETEVPTPGPGEVTITVRAAGMNPANYKRFAPGPRQTRDLLPLSIGFEVSGVISEIGPAAEIASGGGAVGDEVLAAMVSGGYASALTVPARIPVVEAANLLLAGTTAMLAARTFPLGQAKEAIEMLLGRHASGKFALIPGA